MTVPALLTIHTDGAWPGNPGPAAFAYVIARDGEEAIEEAGKIGRMTNNQAEYTALVPPGTRPRTRRTSPRLGSQRQRIAGQADERPVPRQK